MDDALQHRRLIGDISILLTDFANPWWTDSFLPAGRLRDGRSQYKRAQIIIVTKCPDKLTDNDVISTIEGIQPSPNQNVFFTRVVYGQPIHFHGPDISVNRIKSWIGIAGIAKPLPFFQFIEKQYPIKSTSAFPDHHIFSQLEVENLASECGTFGQRSTGWITTEKDAMRLKEMKLPEDIPMYFIPISIAFVQNENDFNNCVDKLLSEKNNKA
ncbi:MAG: tetraacyldisaccharide 4'-kinase [Flavobacteriales bacterium]